MPRKRTPSRPDRPASPPERPPPGHAADERSLSEQTPMHSRDDDAADVEGKDIVQLGSEGSFPASDPPSWMGAALPGGREPEKGKGAR